MTKLFNIDELENKISHFYSTIDKNHYIETSWCKIFGDMGSDKGIRNNPKIRNAKWHNYSRFYYNLLSDKTEMSLNIFEMGLGTTNKSFKSSMGSTGVPGASHYAWSEIFSNSNIYGADIDQDIVFVSPDKRISTCFCDQTIPESVKSVFNFYEVKYDIILDDGLHTPEANICMFENSYEFLKEGGLYIIEDLNMVKYRNQNYENLVKIKEKYNPQYAEILVLSSEVNRIDNVIMVILK